MNRSLKWKRMLAVLVLALAGRALAEGAPAEPHPNAGFGNEAFFLRSDDDNFVLLVAGRLQMDFYAFQPAPGQPFTSFLPKRARIELFGTYLKHFDFQIGAEYTGGAPAATDIYVNAYLNSLLNLQLGQFDAPFTMENRTSDKWFDQQERNFVVRAFAVPQNKEIGVMYWGMPEAKWAYWSIGLFNGEGQNVFPHRSNKFDVMGRAWIAPLALAGQEALKNAWIGGSFWAANRDNAPNNQVDRLAMKTQGGLTFFNPVAGPLHAGDQGPLFKWGVELNVPVSRFVFKGELIGSSESTRETVAGADVRRATLSGIGAYARASYFVFGDPLINGLAGTQLPPHPFGALKPGKTEPALQLVLDYGHLSATYGNTSDGADGTLDPLVGDTFVDAVQVGVNYWYTKHVRLTADFLYNFFSGSAAARVVPVPSTWEIGARVALAL